MVIPQGTVAELLALLDADRARLREVLAGAEHEALSRSSDGKWTVIENLRHLLFVAQALGQYTPAGVVLSPLCYPPPGLWGRRQFSHLTFDATPTAADVLAEWDTAHASFKHALTRDDPEVRLALGKNVRHLRGHIKQIQSALRAGRAGAVRPPGAGRRANG